ncbi:transposable element Tcb1 transposase [Trichonephila clavipes]|nr:transposable element Tcb1 transposase [Trichonephila clavipes]
MTDNFWKKVIFSDESKFTIFGSDSRRTIWRKPNTALNPKNLRPTVKHGGGSVMIWGCTRVNGKFAQFCIRVKKRREVAFPPSPESLPWSGNSEREEKGDGDQKRSYRRINDTGPPS